ncbi:nucleolar protein 58 [Galendromus occidentalis]|uniref:Nucleolar protein 58 n=1 Tax=Galendromus occidentalis TaxID=34638 RepID=A0AAJ6QTK6_9ACAR|nr:nucleolar protein 58 [Galendromus occidentalis]
MLVLFESPAGFAVFKVLDEKKIQKSENLFKEFEDASDASKILKLKHFQKFEDMTQALSAATGAIEGKLTKPLKKILKKLEATETLAVADAKLGNIIKEKMDISCVANSSIQELMRCIRSQQEALITGLSQKEVTAMALGLAHSLSRYKLKFSPDKVDTMIIQAVSLLDDLDKELNNYVMRCKEWYGWHFPEMGKVVTDNMLYVKTVCKMGMRSNAITLDLSDILPEDQEAKVKELAEVSMGTEIAPDDVDNIKHLCEEVIQMTEYRATLHEYLKNRMAAVAPNLTILVGELVGARLIAHAGSLLNLSKQPASTVQILGAEKALFRALKTKHDTPKYGLIYHAQMVGQSSQKCKGKASRWLAAKAALAIRVDALGEDNDTDMSLKNRANLEARLKMLEEGKLTRISKGGKSNKFDVYKHKSEVHEFKPANDSTIGNKRKSFGADEEQEPKHFVKKAKHFDEDDDAEKAEAEETPAKKAKNKKKKSLAAAEDEGENGLNSSVVEGKIKKKKKSKVAEEVAEEEEEGAPKKKKKKKSKAKSSEDEEEE